jgi:hypothetical protein
MPWNQDCTAGMAELGILNFPTIASVAQDQQQLLERLKNTSVEPSLYEGLEHCSAAKCGRPKCSDACRFGAYRKKRTSIPWIHWLLSEYSGPLYEMRFRRVAWSQLFGDLHPSVGTIMKRNRRALDDLFNNRLVAVGAIKVSVANGAYICEIHQIVAGAAEHALKRAFVPSQKVEATSFIWTKEIENIGPVIYSVLDHGLRRWKNPRQRESPNEVPEAAKATRWHTVSPVTLAAPSNATNDCWREYYAWRLGLPYGAWMIRYGCDPYFNLLHKAQRTPVKKVRKKHPYPYWLEPYMFGRGRWTHTDPQGTDYVPKRLRIQGDSSGDPKVDYFSLDDDEQ